MFNIYEIKFCDEISSNTRVKPSLSSKLLHAPIQSKPNTVGQHAFRMRINFEQNLMARS